MNFDPSAATMTAYDPAADAETSPPGRIRRWSVTGAATRRSPETAGELPRAGTVALRGLAR